MLENLIMHYEALIYAGNMDLSTCNPLGVSRALESMQWPGVEEFKDAPRCVWHVDGKSAGITQRGGRLTWLVLLNSGHLVPMSQPRRALEMARLLIDGELQQLCTPYKW